jgi:hypothetical protein
LLIDIWSIDMFSFSLSLDSLIMISVFLAFLGVFAASLLCMMWLFVSSVYN